MRSPDWPPSFPPDKRSRLLVEKIDEIERLPWTREDLGEGNIEWACATPYSETMYVIRDSDHTFHAIYQLNGDWEDPVLDEQVLGDFSSWALAKSAVVTYTAEIWACYQAWEDRLTSEMAQDQAREDYRHER